MRVDELIAKRGYSTEQAGAIARKAHLEVPPFLYAKLVEHCGPLSEILDLGCGRVYPEVYSKCEGLSRVNLIDPNAEVRQGEPRVSIYVNPNVKQGLNAIAMHPGFSLGRWGQAPLWQETLAQLKPTTICFCTYTESEMNEDLDYLTLHGYDTCTVQVNEQALPLYPGEAYYGGVWAIVTRR